MKNKLKKLLESMHDSYGVMLVSLLVLSSVDLTSILVFFVSISVDTLTTIQFVSLGFVAVVLKVRARIKNQIAAWFFWTLITFFGGFMFMMNTIIIQGDDTKPDYVEYAYNDYIDAKQQVSDMLKEQEEYRNNNQRTLASSMEDSISKARIDVTEKKSLYDKSVIQWDNEPKDKIKAVEIFARIPYIVQNPTSGILIASIFFIILFASIEASVFSIAGELSKFGKEEKEDKKEPVKKVKNNNIGNLSFDFSEKENKITDVDYKFAAEYTDGSVKIPSEVALVLGITTEEAEKFHSKLYPGYIFRDGKYIKLNTK